MVKVAEVSVGSNTIATNVSKLPEGNFNKAFLVAMQDGSEVVVKIPNPNSGRRHYTTASEAATMTYVREELKIPAPKVLAYCSRTEESKLGAEYLVMEKASGIELSRVWDTLKPRKKIGIVKQLASFTSRLGNTRFPRLGSLYYREDIKDLEKFQIDGRFAIGPTAARSWFDNRRGEVETSRGPWETCIELMDAVVQRELLCVKQFPNFPRDRQQGIFNGPGGYRPTKQAKISVLQDYLKIAPYILPENEELRSGVMWHNDLHVGNIFVDETDNSTITSIIDWQSVPIYPMFLHADHPPLIDYEGDKPDTFEPPELPPNIRDLPFQEKEAAKTLFIARSLWTTYEIETQKTCPALIQAFRQRETLLGLLQGMIGSIFEEGEPHVQSLLADLSHSDNWKKIVGADAGGDPQIPCPLRYTDDEINLQQEEHAKWVRDVEIKARMFEELGVYTGWNGAVPPEQYESMLHRLKQAKQRFLEREACNAEEREAWEKAWPFKDTES
ncbi:putative phosphotransferase enzyme family protein [Phaeomoniella chlamydospora]|uniref:Putative phosphotransferase enzyme family protein n=1 Tax=Phaeomoniella chlamydospora TaxID=158046 RepID=A0A0G2E5W0_PHACM|nr:putative phosphotransferase enzyme family protein [Phaeomoniella chlamydospora]